MLNAVTGVFGVDSGKILIDGVDVTHLPEYKRAKYTKALISAVPIADPELGRKSQRIPIQGELPSPMNSPKGCRFCTRCPYATDKCREEHPEFREIQPGHFARCHML